MALSNFALGLAEGAWGFSPTKFGSEIDGAFRPGAEARSIFLHPIQVPEGTCSLRYFFR